MHTKCCPIFVAQVTGTHNKRASFGVRQGLRRFSLNGDDNDASPAFICLAVFLRVVVMASGNRLNLKSAIIISPCKTS